MGKCCLHASSFIFDRIIVKVAGNQDRHKSSVKFDFRLNQTYHFGVTCLWMTKISHFWTWVPIDLQWENGVCMLAHSFLIKSSSKLLVTRTDIKARMSLISGLWFPWPIYMFLKWDLTLAHWTQASDRCPLGYLLDIYCNFSGVQVFQIFIVFEPRHYKSSKMCVHPAKTQISLGIRPVWSESSLCAQWVAKDQAFFMRMPRLIWVFTRRTAILLVLSSRGSFG